MLVPLSWIRDFTPVDAPVDALVGALNQLGLEVDGLDEPGRELGGIRAARILDVLEHPDADRLRLAELDTGEGQLRVVCGAPNIVPGMVVPFAPVGARLPGGLTLERRTIRGVASEGMLLSAAELGLGDDHGGILELDPTTVIGADVREVLELDDVVFDLAVTPNRPDAMCVVGVARELAAHFGWPLTVPEPVVPVDPAATVDIRVEIDAPDRCPRYVARVATVQTGPSPPWLARRLVKAGLRPISNVVDVTNYVLLERNQPLHAFDLDRLAGPGIVVRTARSGERITTLDGVERELSDEDLLICDGARTPQAIAGIMGGGDSEVSAGTARILLEAAYFERMGIAKSSKRLKLRSEASARFERGIDPDAVDAHAARAMELLAQVAGARVAPEVTDAHPRPASRPRIHLRTDRVNALLGTALAPTEVRDALEPLGIAVTGDGPDFTVDPPSFRPDLEREVDLVEEVARRVGFGAIGRTVPKPRHQIGGLSRVQRDRRLVADALVGAGCSEAITLPLVAAADLERAGAPTDRLVAAANPLRAEESVLRTRLLPGLLRAAAANRAKGIVDLALFEVGRVFLAPEAPDVLPAEPNHVAIVLAGAHRCRPVADDRPVDAFDARDVLMGLVDALGLASVRIDPADRAGFAPGRAAAVVVDGAAVGSIGEVAADVVAAVGLDGAVAAFEVDLERMVAASRRDRTFRPPSPYPPATIDLAFVVADAVPAATVGATLEAAAGDLAEAVRLFDEFRAEALGEGRRSLAFALRLRAPDRTLTDREVADVRAACIEAVEQRHGASLRA